MYTGRDAAVGKKSAMQLTGSTPDANVKGKSQVPLVNQVYSARMYGMKKLSQSFFQECRLKGEKYQVLVLGSGYDTAYNDCGGDVYLVDFSHVISERLNLCSQADNSDSIKMVGADLCDAPALLAALRLKGFDSSACTLVVLESVMTYMDTTSSENLIRMLAVNIPSCLVVEYDPLLPPSTPSLLTCAESMRRVFASRQAPLRSGQPSTQDVCAFFRSCGMKHAVSLTVQQMLLLCNSGVAPGASEPFDEFASLAMLHRTYAFSISTCSASLFSSAYSTFFSSSFSKAPELSNHRLALRIALLEDRIKLYEATSCTRKFEILKATPSDLSSVMTLFTEGHQEFAKKYASVRAHIKKSGAAIKNTLNDSGNRNNREFWVAVESPVQAPHKSRGLILGCISLDVTSREQDRVGSISHLSVTESSRRRGIGRALVKKVMDKAWEIGCSTIELTTLLDMAPARKLYVSLGFNENEIIDIGGGCNLVHMILRRPDS
mmetsp:Transcript_22372/g.32600  ORF Transcript_22372/g.32600 Transcript_22372/m.32600 type:complete len:491 (+) Transcript_22372:78-1550(+)|eukprot:CAMPEP_0185030756 /NCGR_PEP_ID=MMETSP1103-20130426/17797_1 /TAXON_ID=36769 /ORGANISM="Paraphysomonas bandaiensis, Strain Caron Lab Isolate" /LENGTH=490 /DNA_ID=CAMNT_0027565999 /DNA_START=27 /DNA_END=1499 /DNA_ORIENTATION=+